MQKSLRELSTINQATMQAGGVKYPKYFADVI